MGNFSMHVKANQDIPTAGSTTARPLAAVVASSIHCEIYFH